MPVPSYNLRRVFWPVWVWAAHLHDGSVEHGFTLGKVAARWAARSRIRRARRSGEAMEKPNSQP